MNETKSGPAGGNNIISYTLDLAVISIPCDALGTIN